MATWPPLGSAPGLSTPFRATKVLRFSTMRLIYSNKVDADCTLGGGGGGGGYNPLTPLGYATDWQMLE